MSYDEIMDKWGTIDLKFTRYYKYVFYYTGKTADGYSITAGYGGCSSDIYRNEVLSDEVIKLETLYASEITIHKDGAEVASYYNY